MDSSVLEIVRNGKVEKHEWNGRAGDRAKAKAAFDEAMANGISLAAVVDAPGKSTHVRSFDEIDQAVKERGTVTVRQTAPLVGG